MKFIELLKERRSENLPDGFRMFHGITAGPIILSVQASARHYCTPRRTLSELSLYTKWEVGLVENNTLIRPEDCGLDEFSEYFEGGTNPVAGYVPTDIVQKMFDKLTGSQPAS